MPIQLVEPGQTPEIHDTPKGVVVGIDLGTTHSVVAYVPDKKPEKGFRDCSSERLL